MAKIQDAGYRPSKSNYFTLGALRELLLNDNALGKLPDKTPIFMFSDDEGNACGKLWEVDVQDGKVYLWGEDFQL